MNFLCSCNAYTHHVRDISVSFTDAHKNWHYEMEHLWGEYQLWHFVFSADAEYNHMVSCWKLFETWAFSGEVNQVQSINYELVITLECAFSCRAYLSESLLISSASVAWIWLVWSNSPLHFFHSLHQLKLCGNTYWWLNKYAVLLFDHVLDRCGAY